MNFDPSAKSTGAQLRQNVDVIEPGFALPSTWKANLAFDHELPWYGTVFSAEVLVTNVKDGIVIDRLDMFNAAGNGVTAGYGIAATAGGAVPRSGPARPRPGGRARGRRHAPGLAA